LNPIFYEGNKKILFLEKCKRFIGVERLFFWGGIPWG